jgi:hypothetical protein
MSAPIRVPTTITAQAAAAISFEPPAVTMTQYVLPPNTAQLA